MLGHLIWSGSQNYIVPQPSANIFQMKIADNKVGLVIGKGGEAIKSMQAKSEACIQGLFGRKNCSKQAQVLGCSVCNGGHELQFRSFILAKYVTCVGHLDAYSEMIYCSRYGRFSRITSVSLKPY